MRTVRTTLAPLLAEHNPGLLLHLVVLSANLAGMFLLTGAFADIARRAAADDRGALLVLLAGSVARFVLAPLGATLTRWHYHQRRGSDRPTGALDLPGGCLFNPIFYFCLAAVIFSAINSFILHRGVRAPGVQGHCVRRLDLRRGWS